MTDKQKVDFLMELAGAWIQDGMIECDWDEDVKNILVKEFGLVDFSKDEDEGQSELLGTN